MPKTNLERNTFVRGLITEASPLTFPENASIEEDNFVLNRDGSRQRRLGMDFEDLNGLINTAFNSSYFNNIAITSYKWENVADLATLTVGVVQIGNVLHLLDLGETAPSDNVIDTVTVPSTYLNVPLQYAAIKGVLVVVGVGGTSPFYIQRDSATSYSFTNFPTYVRDIWGVDDGLAVDERPTTLSDEHAYNLLNQGWTETNYNLVGYPSNSDIMQYGKTSTDAFTKAFLDLQFFGNTPAAKGKHIINAFARGVSRHTATGLLSTWEGDSGSITTVAAYAGRMFYSGVRSEVYNGDSKSPIYTGTIFFSRLVDNLEKLGQCYQEADPTSEHVSDLLATDGGTIDIPEAANIYKLIVRGARLVVIAENGVWEITGPDGVFKADDFSISQITTVGAIGPDSIINVEGNIMYWSDGGIYLLSPNETSGKLGAQNISETTIQTFYNDIPSTGKLYAKGNYDSASRKVSWLYNDRSAITSNHNYNKELVFDTTLQAFYPHTIGTLDTDSPYIVGYLPTTSFNTISQIDEVVANGVPVEVDGEQVVVTTSARGSGLKSTKYITIQPDATTYKFTLSGYNNTSFLDWEDSDSVGMDAPASLLTGYELFADSQRNKHVPYLTTHFRRTETGFTDIGNGNLSPISPSSCLLQAQWDFANSVNSGKWGRQFQAYRLTRPYMPSGTGDTFDYGVSMITTKNRLRGSGKALSLKFDTEAGKDLHMYGWGMGVEGGSNV